MNAGRALLSIQDLTVRYGATRALDRVSLDIGAGEFFVLLGPSGSGKTTLLRAIAGFVRPDSGRLLLDGGDLSALPPHRRPVNTMFQSYALFPHMTVAGNIAFGLRRQGVPRREIAARVDAMLALVRLEGFGARRPYSLSGGQQQRAALARSLAPRPRLLLLDEPLSALDRNLRERTREELVQLQRRLGTTFIMVTHDQHEALSAATRIGVMQEGRLAQTGTPREVYERPRTRFVAEFLGAANILEGRVRAASHGTLGVELPGGRVVRAHGSGRVGEAVALAVRPEQLRLGNGDNAIEAIFAEAAYGGDRVMLTLRLPDGSALRATCAASEPLPAPGACIAVSWPDQAAVVLQAEPAQDAR